MHMSNRPPILLFSWGFPISDRPCRNNDIAEELCDYFDVFYLSHTIKKVRKYRFTIINTRLFLFLNRRGLHKLAAFMLFMFVRLLSLSSKQPLYILNMGDDSIYLRHLPYVKYHFDLIDPCISTQEVDQANYDRFISDQVAISTSTSATAFELWRKLCDSGANPILIPNATFYLDGSEQVEQRPDFWDDSYKNVITYVGQLNIRVDFQMIELVSNSAINSVVILTSKPTSEVSSAVDRLTRLDNVILAGHLSDPEILYILRRTSIGLIPFVVDGIGNCINPQKLYDYCAFGFPIISTRTVEMERFSQFVHFVDDHNSMTLGCLIDDLLHGEEPHMVRIKRQLATESTWKARAVQFRDALLNNGN
jgi:hypothetical protein